MIMLIGKLRKKVIMRFKRFMFNVNKVVRKKENVRFILKYIVYEYLEVFFKINVVKVVNFVYY